MDHDSLHVLDLSQVLNDVVHRTVIVRLKKNACGVQPLVDDVHVQAWAQEVVAEKLYTLGSFGKVVVETVDRQSLLRSRRSSRWPLAMGVWT